jgi:hypothetical protein
LRVVKAVALTCAALCACAAILLQTSSGATAAVSRASLTYDPATQSHPGACSQNTVNVSQAVSDLSANGILGQYAVLVGVHATGAALQAQMRQTLVVLHVAANTVTANHGCTTDGLIFPTGSRTLTVGETVGVGLPASVRAELCGGPAAGCQRVVLTEHTVFPTNCWNLNQGTVQVVVYLHKPQVKPRPKTKPQVELAKPRASVSTTCGTGNAGTSTVTLSNGADATAAADFNINGRAYGPLKAGQSKTVQVALGSSAATTIKVTSDGQMLVDQLIPPDPCPVSSAPLAAPVPPSTPAPSATATLSCSAGGVVVTLNNAPVATAAASFVVNGETYGPLAPGASQNVTVAVAPGSTGALTVSSGGRVILSGASFTNSCAADPTALATVDCAPWFIDFSGGGTLVVQLIDGASASLPASFVVTAAGNTTSGYGPQTVGPIGAGGTRTLLIPVDASGTPVQVTVSAGGKQLVSQTFAGCMVAAG